MKEIKPTKRNYQDKNEMDDSNEYYPVEENGVMKCSCGNELIKMDEETYRCSGGYPIYRFSDGTLIIDKYGNICIKKMGHGGEEDEVTN